MTERYFKDRLDKIADTLPRKVLSGIKPMPFDRWICMSLMQKACRRGDAALAGRAALTLWSQNKRALYRRLVMIAVEDVAMGDLEAVLDVMAVARAPALWRKAVGEAALAVFFAERMARTAKTRFLTELYLYSDHAKQAAKARKWTAKASFEELTSILHDPTKEAPEQVLALFGLFGSRRFGVKNFQRPDGHLEEAIKAVKEMPVPEEILAACTATVGTPHFPLAMLLPVGWLEMQREAKNLTARKEIPVSSPECRGLPMYAVDGLYTRVGIESIKRLKKAVPGLVGYTSAQIGEGYFFLEAENLNPRLICPAWDRFRRDSIFATMLSLGLDEDEYLALNRALIKHYDLYNDIRIAKIEALCPTADLFEGEE